MDKNYTYALGITFFYSLIGFINKNSNPELKGNLKKFIHWVRALSTAVIDAGFAMLFFAGITHFKPEWSIVLQVGLAVFLAVFVAETFVDKIKDVVTKWKI